MKFLIGSNRRTTTIHSVNDFEDYLLTKRILQKSKLRSVTQQKIYSNEFASLAGTSDDEENLPSSNRKSWQLKKNLRRNYFIRNINANKNKKQIEKEGQNSSEVLTPVTKYLKMEKEMLSK